MHKKINHAENSASACNHCHKIMKTNAELLEHVQNNHKETLGNQCERCDKCFRSEEEIREHICKAHEEATFSGIQDMIIDELNCQKCDKKYGNMSKLRRHDWRSHRTVDCNICGEVIRSRQDISNHRQSKHGIHKKTVCKFFPNCIDEGECFFEHKNHKEPEYQRNLDTCPNSESCTDQSC